VWASKLFLRGSGGEYASVQCEATEKMPDIECKYGHSAGKGKID
jgi:hypothetical protein